MSAKLEYEYKKVLLPEGEANNLYIPMSLIINKELDTKRIGVLTYLRMCCGADNISRFTVPNMVKWCGFKADRRMEGMNSRFLSIMDELSDGGYFTYLGEKSRSSYMECKFNMIHYRTECSSTGYAIVYIDELQKIMGYKDTSVANTTILLVFAYLRNKIFRRPNGLKPEERTLDGIKERRERCPEAFAEYIVNMADEIGISAKTFAKVINVLEDELHLIVTDNAYRIKSDEGEFRTLPTMFANAYKRDDRYLLITGDDYSRTEIELKARKMNYYKINTSKRKSKKGVTCCE